MAPADDRPHGVFATRSPLRPNPIGLTVVELIERDGCSLRVAGVDMLDGHADPRYQAVSVECAAGEDFVAAGWPRRKPDGRRRGAAIMERKKASDFPRTGTSTGDRSSTARGGSPWAG